jgi:hypothetical protein
MENYSTQVQVYRSEDGILSLMHTICFRTQRMIHDTERFREGLEILLKLDEELESGRQPIQFDKIK